jgi:hypothetical protein
MKMKGNHYLKQGGGTMAKHQYMFEKKIPVYNFIMRNDFLTTTSFFVGGGLAAVGARRGGAVVAAVGIVNQPQTEEWNTPKKEGEKGNHTHYLKST